MENGIKLKPIIESQSIYEVGQNFEQFVNYCNDRVTDVGHCLHSNIANTSEFAEIKKLVANKSLDDAFFVKSYSVDSHTMHQSNYIKHGFNKNNTRMQRREIADNPIIADFAKNYLKLNHARVKINSQPPGNFFPTHIDMMASWTDQNPTLAKKYCYPQFKRFLLFLQPRLNGHFYSINNKYVDYTEGDIIDQYYFAWHATGNADLENKTLIVFEGIHQDD